MSEGTFTPVKEGWEYYRLVADYWAADHKLMAVPDHYFDPDADDEDVESLDVAYWIVDGWIRHAQTEQGFPGVGENGWQFIRDGESARTVFEYEDGGEIEAITFEEAMAIADPLWDLITGEDEG